MPVYFIQAADGIGPIKIGIADNPQKRLKQIQRMSPVPLQTLRIIEGDADYEATLHYHFRELRLYGEWFNPGQQLLDFIENPVELEPMGRSPLRIIRSPESQRLQPITGQVQQLDKEEQLAFLDLLSSWADQQDLLHVVAKMDFPKQKAVLNFALFLLQEEQ